MVFERCLGRNSEEGKNMKKPNGVRIDEAFLEKVERLSEEENVDRSTMLRKLLEQGYEAYMKKKAAEQYKAGKITLSKATKLADVTLWTFEQYLVQHGYKSEYAIKDLERELKNITTNSSS